MSQQIKTFEDACKALNIDATAIMPNFDVFPEKHRKAMTAHAKLIIIAEALNEGWQPDWNNSDQWKYYPWFEVEADEQRPAGFGFSYAYYGLWHSCTNVGSRLCFKSRELALYAGKEFGQLYIDYFLIQ